jgi:serine/threonine protein kinase
VVLNAVKIVDFGLAKLAGTTECLTATDALLGTVAYLPPELLQGHETDHRGDVWSSGVVFYEMLAGTPPFTGPNSYVVLHAIMHDEVQSILQHRPELPPGVQAVVARVRAKSRADRYQSAGEFLLGLDHLDGTATPGGSAHSSSSADISQEKSIVVLPFVVLGADSQGDVFSDGLTDEVITDLSAISRLRVICRKCIKWTGSACRSLHGIAICTEYTAQRAEE